VLPSSRTPEGWPSRCPLCREVNKINFSDPAGDATCPSCGHLLWHSPPVFGEPRNRITEQIAADVSTPPPQSPTPTLAPRRYKRLGLRLLLLVVSLVAARIANNAGQVYQQHAAIERIIELGGDVKFSYEISRDSLGRYCCNQSPLFYCPESLSGWIGVEYFRTLVGVRLSKTAVTDDDLRLLGEVPTIENLNLAETKITNEGLRHLKKLPKLQWLGLAGTKIDDQGLEHLAMHKKMWCLILDKTAITDDGLAHLETLTDLEEWLGLEDTKVSNAGLVHLRNCKKLRRLNLWHSAVTRSGKDDLQTELPSTQIYWGR
jgi:hypothetical protein